ncbi:LOW QUALITY PROTEIN: katanin p80 WD40 repeat-containing subunit B1 [Perca flavescens]|uniref:LOW QUALITY PROTEIN: katanin p80 WD40 repeat-containing subunit B1 n=1 Tax=Perca flavescens TaxID=8167 RepID=UPI00106F05AC|nr:LOW QUALITY PROTEIN: katanin p80 WD40 repeat-containing subunit B1 [Perca flavescens]
MAAASTTKISWRLQEFEAHSSSVTCLALGKSSGRLLATGGEDCRVNIWAVSKANCIMSLTGHRNPVECVQFNTSEEQVVAGSQSGSIRVWDLEAAKIFRTLMGHKSNITSLGFHPFGQFLASSSMDTNIKLWDVRRKGYVFRYKGHTQAVRSLAFSPDGKWLASASDDCTVKLWDLTQGKTITEFKGEKLWSDLRSSFHPNEYLLASGSSDRTVKLWDLEKFTMIGSLEGDTTPVRCVFFSSDGSCLYSGSTDSLRIFGWEPDRCFDVVPVGWGKVSDLAICNQQLIGVSHQLSSVSSYVVDLKRVKKSGGSMIQGIIQDNQPLTEPKDPKGAALRRNYERPTTTCSSQRVKQSSEADRRSPEGERRSPSEDEADEKLSSAEIHNAEDFKEIFQPKNAISRTPPKISEPFPAPPEDDTVLAIGRQLKDISPFPEKLQPPPLASSTPVQRVEPTVVSCAKRPAAPASAGGQASSNPPASCPPPPQPPVITAKPKPPNPKIILSRRNEPIGLNVADFLPSSPNNRAGSLSDEDALSQLKKGHDTMCVMLRSRHKNLETIRAVWAREDIKSALDAAVSMNDLSIVVDILNIINLQPSLWKLDLCITVLPQIDQLLQSKYESYIQTGCTSLKLIMKHFWMLISDTLKAAPSVGVDITREERHLKCRACCKQLKNLSSMVRTKAAQIGRHGSAFKELQLLMAPLDDSL